MILVSWIRIRNPHSKGGFQMRMRIRDKLRKNSADDKKNWTGLRLNNNRFYALVLEFFRIYP
jgi:hypothetical protein